MIRSSGGPVKVHKQQGRHNYLGSYSHGVQSQALSRWTSSFTVARRWRQTPNMFNIVHSTGENVTRRLSRHEEWLEWYLMIFNVDVLNDDLQRSDFSLMTRFDKTFDSLLSESVHVPQEVSSQIATTVLPASGPGLGTILTCRLNYTWWSPILHGTRIVFYGHILSWSSYLTRSWISVLTMYPKAQLLDIFITKWFCF